LAYCSPRIGSHKADAHDDIISRRLLEIVEGLRPVGG